MGLGPEDENDDAIKQVIGQAHDYVQLDQETHGGWTVYTREIKNRSTLIREAKEIMLEQRHQFMIQIQIAYILKDINTSEYSLYYASSNTELFPNAIKVRNRDNIQKVASKIRNHDWDEFFSMPKSGLIPVRLVYARYIVASDSLPLTSCDCYFNQLPEWLKKNRYIVWSNQCNTCKSQCDKVCIFRAIAEHFIREKNHFFGRTRLQIQKKLFSIFSFKYGNPSLSPQDFNGVHQDELPLIEEIFSVKINLYIFEYLSSATPSYPKQLRATPIYFSQLRNPINGQCNLLHYIEHVCYIIDVERALGHLVCAICEKKQSHSNYSKHFKFCSNKFKQRGENGQVNKYHDAEQYKIPLEILEEIEQECNTSFPFYVKQIDYLAVFDSEVWFDTFSEPKKRGKSTLGFSELKPFVIGVCSNVPGFEKSKLFWITEHGELFIENMVNYFIQISAKQKQLLQEQLSTVFDALEYRLERALENENKYGSRLYEKLIKKLEKFISQLPILSFNGAKFDCRVLRRWLLPALFKQYGNDVKTQMKQATYSRIITTDFLIIDQLNYLAGKSSYDNWIFNSLGLRLKSKLPYSWIKSLDCLDYLGLPDLPEWYSTLKGYNVLSIDYDSYIKYLSQGISSEQAMKNLGLKHIPKPGPEAIEDYSNYSETTISRHSKIL